MNTRKLKALVEASSLSNREIAAACHISATTLYNALAGMDVKISTVEALAGVLGVPVGFLFDDSTMPAPVQRPSRKTVKLSLELSEKEVSEIIGQLAKYLQRE